MMRLIIVVASVISGFVVISLVFFQATRKTYPGFGRWTAGVGFLTVGYLALALRGFIPDAFSIFLSNGGFSVGMVFLLDGLRRFLGLTPMSGLWYALPAMDLVAIAVLYYVYDLAYWRTVVTAIAVAAPHLPMAAILFRHPVKYKSIFYPVIGALLCAAGLVVLARPMSAFFLPQWHLFMDSPFQLGSLITLIVLQLAESLSLMMLNSERVESELTEAEAELRLTVDRLRQALAEQKRAEESLRESEERYRNFFDTSRDCVFMTTLDGLFVDFNDVALETLGYEQSRREEVLGKKVSDFYAHPEERNAHAAMVAEIGFSKEYPIDLRKRDGTIIHTLITTVARKDLSGRIIGFQGTVRDITDLKKAEKALRQSQEMLSLALDGANLGIWDWDLTTGKAVWAQRALRMFGYEPHEFEPNLKNWKKLVHPGDWPMVAENLNLHIEGRVPMFESEYRMLNKSGDWQWVQAQGKTVEFDADGKPIRMTGVIADATDRKKAEENLRLSEAKFLDLYENAPCAYFSVGTDGTIRLCNPRAGELLGYSREELIGKLVFQLYSDRPEGKEKAGKLFERFVDGEPITDEELRMQRADGTTLWISLTVNGIRDSVGQLVESRSMVLDISDRKRAEEEREDLRSQLLQAQKMEAIGTLTGGIAHDFNNLLTIINGFAEMILLETKEDDPRRKDLMKILQTGQKGADMVQRLLAFSRREQLRLEPLDLNRLVENLIKLVGSTFPKIIEIETIKADELGLINGDAVQVEQVLMNLSINAKEAMPDGGRMRIETRNITVDEDYCRLHVGARPGRYALIEVSDTGVGMNKETMERMFDPFFTKKGWDFKKGTGLGLSVAKGIVEQHGGWITCQSEPGKGAVFSVYFPVIKAAPVVRKPESLADTFTGTPKILLVDDEEHVRDLGKRILEHAGYMVITAGNGKEAVEIYSREQADIALVVLDLTMPQMEGKQCLEELLKINPDVKVIVSTGHALDARESLLLGALARGFVNKPYELKQMVQAVKRVLEAGGSAG